MTIRRAALIASLLWVAHDMPVAQDFGPARRGRDVPVAQDSSTARPEAFDSPLILSLSKDERLAQDRPVEGRALRAGFGPAQGASAPGSSPAPGARDTLDRYCVTCHNERLKTGGLMLDRMDLARVSEAPDVWEKVVRKLRTGAMPPPGARRPDPASADVLASWLETTLDRAAAVNPNPGPSLLRRLNRTEYANAIRDLLAVDVDVASLLPPDNAAYGFDNIADVLGVSPSLQERYLNAAEKISALAIGDLNDGPASDTYRVRQDLSQNRHLDGLPLGTVGGLLVRHMFPLDGEYSFQVKLYRTNFGNLRGLEHPHEVEITIDGTRVHAATIGGDADLAAAFAKPTPSFSPRQSPL